MKATDIAEAFDVSLDDAKLALKIMNWKVKPTDFPDRLPKTCDQYRYLDTDKFGTDCSCRLDALNELLGTHGVEPIRTSEHLVQELADFDRRISDLEWKLSEALDKIDLLGSAVAALIQRVDPDFNPGQQ